MVLMYLGNMQQENRTDYNSTKSTRGLQREEFIGYTFPPKIRHLAVKKPPESFDARDHWPNCESLDMIVNQGSCASGWAQAAVSVLNDRLCIHTNGTRQFLHSAQDLMTCCDRCGFGCSGGYPGNAWNYWKRNGIASGGPYGSRLGCKPYSIEPCGYSAKSTLKPCPESGYTPMCEKTCQSEYDRPYNHDKQFGESVYGIDSHEEEIRYEIWKNGPVQASFIVYEDFLRYESGVYEHKAGDEVRMQSVKILGWGVEDGAPYWLCANSWGQDWGQNGYFRIRRGSNECRIEDYIIAGIPKITFMQKPQLLSKSRKNVKNL